MQNRILCLVAILAAFSRAADHNTFKDCSQNPICSSLRDAMPDASNEYEADTHSINIIGSIVEIQLSNQIDNPLVLQLQLLDNDNWRVIIEEQNSTRYRLQEVLDGEPRTKRITTAAIGNTTLTLRADNSSSEAVVSNNPLKISFLKSGLVEVILSSINFQKGSTYFAFDVSYPNASRLYGLHEHADRLSLRNTEPGGADPYRLRNLDVAGYELNSTMSLYGAIPVLYGHGATVTSGIFLHNAAEQWIETSHSDNADPHGKFMVESGLLDVFVLLGPTPKEIVRQYTNLTGVAHMPQLWTLGYHQCRWNYDSQEDVKDVIANMDNADFPMDAIWLDIEYTDGKKYFTWNPETFSDPLEMQKNISSTNRKLVTIIDPHIKVDTTYPVYNGALEQDLFVKNANGSVFEGDCWPGLSSYMDFLNPAARDYYASYYSYEKFVNSTPTLAGFWNDMNEPSVFDDSIEKTLPGSSLHAGGVLHRDIHNIYGFLHTKSTHQGIMQRDNGTKRPFLLTRSHFAGSQRYAMIWTGDNTADWGYLSVSYAECLNANMLGIVFCGADVGGFFGDPDVELLQRWYQAGAWLPFYRAHANMGTKRREPYLFDQSVQSVIRDAIKIRYQHLPVWYTLFHEHTAYGDPIIRPLFYDYPGKYLDVENQLLVGKDILVRIIAQPSAASGTETVPVTLPGADNFWYQINGNYSLYAGDTEQEFPVFEYQIPIFYRAGSIIVRNDFARANSEDMKNDPITIVINSDQNDQASGTLYIDDYESFDYQEKKYNYVEIVYANKSLDIVPIDEDAEPGEFFINIRGIEINYFPQSGEGKYEKTFISKTKDGKFFSDFKLTSGKFEL